MNNRRLVNEKKKTIEVRHSTKQSRRRITYYTISNFFFPAMQHFRDELCTERDPKVVASLYKLIAIVCRA